MELQAQIEPNEFPPISILDRWKLFFRQFCNLTTQGLLEARAIWLPML
jgi:hypothetical protein